LAQLPIDCKTNKITAVPELLDVLDIKHATITTNALNTQSNIAAKMISRESDYALPVKDNRKNLGAAIVQASDTNSLDRTNKEALFN
jgi:predicted transposase YbfD/YdcC